MFGGSNAPPGADQDSRAPWYEPKEERPEREYEPDEDQDHIDQEDDE